MEASAGNNSAKRLPLLQITIAEHQDRERQPSTLLYVLHLFAHLFDDHFHLDRRARRLQILGF
jgi:hypothetical protein